MQIGPEKLKGYGAKVLKRLVKSANIAQDKGLASRLKKSWLRATPKIDELITRAHKNLQQLPEIFVTCATQTICRKVDNSAAINDYVKTVNILSQSVLRAMNRATRLISVNIQQARNMTDKTGRAIKAERKRLTGVAKGIPPEQSICG